VEHNEFSYDLRKLFTDPYRLTTFGLLVVFVLWWAGIAHGVVAGDSRRQWLIVAGGVFVTAVAYLAALHLSYRFAFGARGLDLPSYVRYVNVIALPMVLLSFCPLLPAFGNSEHKRAWHIRGQAVSQRAAIVAAAAIALYGLETPYLRPILAPNAKVPQRANVEPLLEPLRSIGMSRLWIYFPRDDEDNDFFGRMVQYLLAPTPAAVEFEALRKTRMRRALRRHGALSTTSGSQSFRPSKPASVSRGSPPAWRGRASTACSHQQAARSRSSSSASTTPMSRPRSITRRYKRAPRSGCSWTEDPCLGGPREPPAE
jgi:hypothetical protein